MQKTITVIYLCKFVSNKSKCRSIKSDNAKFYPSTTEDQLDKSINFTKCVTSTYEKVI